MVEERGDIFAQTLYYFKQNKRRLFRKAVIFKNKYHQKGISPHQGSFSLDMNVVNHLAGRAAVGHFAHEVG
jgi:hypothetical protein